MVLKDDLDRLTDNELSSFLFEFIKEPLAYVTGRFSSDLDISDSIEIAKGYKNGTFTSDDLLKEIDYLLHTIADIDDPYDREVLYSIASALLALLYREHAFDAVLHDLDAIAIDSNDEDALSIIPLRIDHHTRMINKIKAQRGENASYYSRQIV